MRWIFRALLLIIVLIAVIGAGLWFFMPRDRIVALAADQVRAATGRELTLTGDVSPSFYPVLGVSTGPLTLSNPDWAEADHLVSASSATIGVEIMPLFSSEIRVTTVRLVDPSLNLERNAEGAASWEFETGAEETTAEAGADETGPTELPDISIKEIIVENGRVAFTDAQAGVAEVFEAVNLTAAVPALDQTVTADGAAQWRGAAATLTLALGSPASLLAAEPANVELRIGLDDAFAQYEGEATLPSASGLPVVDGGFRVSAPSPDAIIALLELPAQPDGAQIESVDLGGELRLTDAVLDIAANGEVTRGGEVMELRLSAKGDDWVTKRAFDYDLSVGAGGLATITATGQAKLDDANGLQRLTAKGSAAVASPAALAEWVGVAAPPEVAEISGVSTDLDLTLGPKGLNATITGGAIRSGRKVDLNVTAKGGPKWRENSRARVDLTASVAELAALRFGGPVSFGDAPGAKGEIKVSSPNLRGLAEWAGAGPIAAPQGTMGPFSLTGDLNATAQRVALNKAAIKLDDGDAAGRVAVGLDGRPRIEADLTSQKIDLRPFQPADSGGNGGGSGGGGAGGWSKAPIDLSGLRGVDADVTLKAEEIRLRETTLRKADLTATLQNGLLTVDIRRVRGFGGGLAGKMRVDGRDQPKLSAQIDAKGVQLGPLLSSFADFDQVIGVGATTLNLNAAGPSMHALMNSLSGKGSIDMRDGAIRGIDLAAIARNIEALIGGGGGSEAQTQFSAITGTFDIQRGKLTNTDLAFLGPLLRITGKGDIGIGQQNMNFRLTPKAVASLVGQGGSVEDSGLAFPILITGTWSNPSFAPDLSGAIENILTDPMAALDQIEGAADAVKSLVEDGDPAKLLQKGVEGVLGDDSPIKGLTGDGSPLDALTGGDEGVGGALKGLLGGGDEKKPAAKTNQQKKQNADKKKKKLTPEERAARKAKREARQKKKAEEAAKKKQTPEDAATDGAKKLLDALGVTGD